MEITEEVPVQQDKDFVIEQTGSERVKFVKLKSAEVK